MPVGHRRPAGTTRANWQEGWRSPAVVLQSNGTSPPTRSPSMFDRISNGFALARSTWGVLMRDKHLIVFPIVSGILFLLVVASFVVPMAALDVWNKPNQGPRFNGIPVWT